MHNIWVFIGSFLGLAIAFMVALNTILNQLSDRRKLTQRLNSISTQKTIFIIDSPGKLTFKRTSNSLLERKISQYLRRRPGRENSFRLKLYRSGLEGKVSRTLMLATVISGVVAFIISTFGLVDFIYIIPLGTFFGCLFTYIIINSLEQRFKRKIVQELPLAIDILLRGIKSGSSIERAFRVIAAEVKPPLQTEFNKILQQIEFGIGFDDALGQASDRIDIADFYFFSCALIIQRRAGGSLSEILENISLSLSRSNEIRGKIKALSAEAKMTAYILGSFPGLIGAIIMFINPAYMSFFKDTQEGQRMSMYVLGLIGLAFIIMRKLIHIKV